MMEVKMLVNHRPTFAVSPWVCVSHVFSFEGLHLFSLSVSRHGNKNQTHRLPSLLKEDQKLLPGPAAPVLITALETQFSPFTGG
jgi:hypothetical protein